MNKKFLLLLICLFNFNITPHSLKLINNSGKTVKITYVYNFYFFGTYGRSDSTKPAKVNLKNKKTTNALMTAWTTEPASMGDTFFWEPGHYQLVMVDVNGTYQIVFSDSSPRIKIKYDNFKNFSFAKEDRPYCFEIIDPQIQDEDIVLNEVEFIEDTDACCIIS